MTKLLAVLLVGAGVGAVVASANASPLGRFGGMTAALLLGGVALGVLARQRWAFGVAFFLGLFWFWAALALLIQAQLGLPTSLAWLGWSLAVMVIGVRFRPDRERDGTPQEDEA